MNRESLNGIMEIVESNEKYRKPEERLLLVKGAKFEIVALALREFIKSLETVKVPEPETESVPETVPELALEPKLTPMEIMKKYYETEKIYKLRIEFDVWLDQITGLRCPNSFKLINHCKETNSECSECWKLALK